jgi:hypothetical protein
MICIPKLALEIRDLLLPATVLLPRLEVNLIRHASYLPEPNARSQVCGHYFLGWLPKNGNPIQLNGAFHTLCLIPKFVVVSATEAELGALFRNCQEGIIFRLNLADLGYPQPETPVHCNNATAVSIANNTIKRQCLQAMEMRKFWVGDKIAQEQYSLDW